MRWTRKPLSARNPSYSSNFSPPLYLAHRTFFWFSRFGPTIATSSASAERSEREARLAPTSVPSPSRRWQMKQYLLKACFSPRGALHGSGPTGEDRVDLLHDRRQELLGPLLAARFLITHQFMTGETVMVDGGMTMQMVR